MSTGLKNVKMSEGPTSFGSGRAEGGLQLKVSLVTWEPTDMHLRARPGPSHICSLPRDRCRARNERGMTHEVHDDRVCISKIVGIQEGVIGIEIGRRDEEV
jgi:hypothetical protein